MVFSAGFYFNINGNPTHAYGLTVVAYGIRAFEPGEIIWTYQHIDNVVCVAVTEDNNSDGLPDIAAEGYDAGAEGDPLVCLSGSGSDSTMVIWSVYPEGGESNAGGYGDDCLAYIDDLNHDGHGDIIRGSAWGSRTIFAIDGLNGLTIWSYDTYQQPPNGWIYSVAPISDINGDSIPEVLAGLGSAANRAYCLSGADGERLWQYVGDDAVASIKSVGDVDDDGFDDAVFATLDYGRYLYCISGASEGYGTQLWRRYIGNNSYSLTTISDINDDGYRDVLTGTWGNGLYAISGHSDSPYGTQIWNYPMTSYIMKVVSCPDINNDGYEDILIGSWSDYVLAVSGSDGSEIWQYYCGDDVWAVDFIDDVNGDSITDVAAGSFNGYVYIISGADAELLGQCYVGAKPFTIRGISDINGDGYNDIIVGTQLFGDTGGEVILVSGGVPEPVSVDDNYEIIPDKFIAVCNYPNPFNGKTTIKFNLDKDCNYALSIYDITGRLVEQVNDTGRKGINTTGWNPAGNKGIVSGVYFYVVKAESKSGHGKMLYLK